MHSFYYLVLGLLRMVVLLLYFDIFSFFFTFFTYYCSNTLASGQQSSLTKSHHSLIQLIQIQKVLNNNIRKLQTLIERMSEAPEQTPSIPIQNMYDITNRNYEWQAFKYQIPRQYLSYNEKTAPPANQPPHKLNYIDDVLKIKKYVPAPNKYEIQENVRPLSGKMDKNPRKTLADTIIHQNKREPSPGPATYFSRPKTAGPTMNKNVPEYREHYLNEVEYLSSESPGVGEYNLNYFKIDHIASPKFNKNKTISRSSSTNFLTKKQKVSKAEKEQISKTLVIGTFDWIATQKKTTNKNFFGKSKRFITGSKFDKKPAPNFYKLNTKWSDSTNILKTSASTTSFRSVYYS